jgi:hypothetical protein
MNTLVREALASEVRFDENNMIVHFTDGRQLYVPLIFFPRLFNAEPEERTEYEISGGGTGLHWEKLDEDISVRFLLMGIFDRTDYLKTKINLRVAA